MSRLRLCTALALLLASGAARAATSDGVVVRSETLRLEFAPASAQLSGWQACTPSCDAPRDDSVFGTPADPPRVRIGSAGDPTLAARIAALPSRVERRDESGTTVLEFLSDPLEAGVSLRQTWRIPQRGYETTLDVAWSGAGADEFARAHPLELELAPGSSFEPQPESGFAGLSEMVSTVQIDGGWSGARNRFWAFLVRSDAPAASAQTFRFYSGPIERGILDAADPALDALLFSHLWFWMRWLSLGLLLLLGLLYEVVGNEGVAILLLAPCVKLLMRPLTATAERWQRGVNATRSQLQPRIDEIKASSSGAERSQRLFALHREHGVSPFYGLKSLLGVLIQIPVFIAAYHMLDENFALSHVSFLWIADLAEPDRVATLPFTIPFFGDSLNLLPFVMSAVTLLSSRLHDDGTLAPELLRRQRYSLYGMAFAFFALFYSFPAGMVLYWTSNNLVALARDFVSRLIPRFRDGTWRLAIDTLRR